MIPGILAGYIFHQVHILRVYPHRASASTLASPLVLAYIATLGNRAPPIPKHHNVWQYKWQRNASGNASIDADARCGYNLRLKKWQVHENKRSFQLGSKLGTPEYLNFGGFFLKYYLRG